MANETPDGTRLLLTDSDGLGRLEVDLEAFFALSFDLAEDLEDLVQTYQFNQRRRSSAVTAATRRQQPRRI